MPLTRKSKWQKQSKKTKEQGTHEDRVEFWDSLMFPKPKKKPKEKKKPQPTERKQRKISLRKLAYEQAEKRDENECVLCHKPSEEHHHIIRQGTRFAPEFIQRMENVVCVCRECHTQGKNPIHDPKGRREKQIKLEQWQEKYYPDYVAMIRELYKVKGSRDEWIIERWRVSA